MDCYVNHEFREVCVLLPMCSKMNILGVYSSAWCGETGMKGFWLNWVLTSLGWQNSPPRLHRTQAPHLHPHSPGTVRNSTAAVPGPVSIQIWAPLKSALLGMLLLGHSWKLCELFWKSLLFCFVYSFENCQSFWVKGSCASSGKNISQLLLCNEQLWEASGQFEQGQRKDLGGKPWYRSSACCATLNLFLTLVMVDVLIWLIFLLFLKFTA